MGLRIPTSIFLLVFAISGCVIEGEDLYHRVEGIDENALGVCESIIDFPTEVQPIFDDACTLCHAGAAPSGQLSLKDGFSYDELVGVGSVSSDKNRIEPGDDVASFLVDRILERDGTTLMPQVGGPLDVSAEINKIICWVNQGAHPTAEDAENAAE